MRPMRARRAIARPQLLGDDPKARITLHADKDARTLSIEDNGIGMAPDEMAEALGTIARSGTRAFVERIEASKGASPPKLFQLVLPDDLTKHR